MYIYLYLYNISEFQYISISVILKNVNTGKKHRNELCDD